MWPSTCGSHRNKSCMSFFSALGYNIIFFPNIYSGKHLWVVLANRAVLDGTQDALAVFAVTAHNWSNGRI